MAWLRSSPRLTPVSSFYRALESLSTLGFTLSIDIISYATNASGPWNAALLVDLF